MTSRYHTQLAARPGEIDLEFWRAPEGVVIPDDELRFLLIPDAVQTLVVGDLAQQVHAFQRENATSGDALTHALMTTMGGLLPGVLLFDHLVYGSAICATPNAIDAQTNTIDAPSIAFGTVGVSLYQGPDQRFETPRVTQEPSLDVTGGNVLLIDDLGDRGDTLAFLSRHVANAGARRVLSLVVYMKPLATSTCGADFHFGEVAQDTWIITPRELVETLVKRVPRWKQRGATQAECQRRLVALIGYPQAVVDHYLPRVYAGA